VSRQVSGQWTWTWMWIWTWMWMWMWMRVQRGGWLAGMHAETEREQERRGGVGSHNNPSPAAPHCIALRCFCCVCCVSASSRFCREFARCMPLPVLSPEPLCLPPTTYHLPPTPPTPPTYIVVLDIAQHPIPPSSIVQASPSQPLKAHNTCPPSPAGLIGHPILSTC
jgi:hypothetical protein